MILKELELYSPFRGLQPGFKITFIRPRENINFVEPLCYTGLNGSGKSNVMQVLAEIFFYLETYVLAEAQGYLDKKTPFGFRIHYQFPVYDESVRLKEDNEGDWYLKPRNVIISKQPNELPAFEYYYRNENEKKAIADAGDWHKLLPNFIIGYSSGMNEILSNPFIKMDFFYLETIKQKMEHRKRQEEQLESEALGDDDIPTSAESAPVVNRLFFLDYQSNALALISNYMMKPITVSSRPAELDVINDIVRIDDIVSFRILINFRVKENFEIEEVKEKLWDYIMMGKDRARDENFTYQHFTPFSFIKHIELPGPVHEIITNLIDCSTTANILRTDVKDENSDMIHLELYFKTDGEMKRAFQDKFRGGAKGLFRNFYLLNLLNIELYSDKLKEEVKKADFSINIADLLPKVPTDEKVFHLDNIQLRKKNGKTLYYKQLSDGEHQYLQVAGSLMLMDDNATLFVMDEPETHFNPEWRSKLISTLNEIISVKLNNDPDYLDLQSKYSTKLITEKEYKESKKKFIPEQELILTTHSPFVVSDCERENVYMFYRDANKGVQFKKPEINTYGTSSHILLKELFNMDSTIAKMTIKTIDDLEDAVYKATSSRDLETIKTETDRLGESIEKFMLLYAIKNKAKELT